MIRLLADENVPLASICRLREAGLEVIAVCEELAGSPDDEILERAVAEEAVIVTFDLDFGALVFQLGLPSPKGIILLRPLPPGLRPGTPRSATGQLLAGKRRVTEKLTAQGRRSGSGSPPDGVSSSVSWEPVTKDLTPAQKLRAAFDLFEAGVDLMRQNIRRSHPEATPEEVDRRLQDWLFTRPGAEHGDCEGRLREPEEPAA